VLFLKGLIKSAECWGTGIQNMKEWMAGHGLPEPEFVITGHSIVTVLKRPATSAKIRDKKNGDM